MAKCRVYLIDFIKCISLCGIFFAQQSAGVEALDNNNNEIKETKRVKFKTNFLKDFNKNIDISAFEEGASIQPGRHPVEVSVNSNKPRVYHIDFASVNGKVTPCIPAMVLKSVSLNEKTLPENWLASPCLDLTLLKGAQANYDYDDEALAVSIPQIYLLDRPYGFIDPSQWDNGINALTANYSLSGSRNVNRKLKHASDSMFYGNLMTTLRVGAWRFNSYDSLTGGEKQSTKLSNMNFYAQRAIGPLLSEFSVGDLNTTGELFNTTSLRGLALSSDEKMLPESVKGYAPEIRGIADSNAVVTISQNGNTLFEQSVPPGEFNIRNLTALGYGGDIDVKVQESNGTVKTFRVPYSSLPQLLRKGYSKYSVTLGEVQSYGLVDTPLLLEPTLQYGISDKVTLYGGFQTTLDNSYKAIISGIALNTALGAFSTDINWSKTPDYSGQGRSGSLIDNSRIKLAYMKSISDTGTSLNMASYYFAGDNYYSLNDALWEKGAYSKKDQSWQARRFRNRIELILSQELGPDWGQLTFNGWWEKENNNGSDQSYSSYLLGYRNGFYSLNYSINFNRTYTSYGKQDTAILFNLSVPFGFKAGSKPQLRAAFDYSNTESLFRTSLNGTLQKEDSAMSFSTFASQSSQSRTNFGINVGHTGRKLQKNISYSQSLDTYGMAGNVSGGVLIHDEGVIFSSFLGDTLALIKAPDGEGAGLLGNRMSVIDSNGYGVMSYLTPYSENTLMLDVKGAPVGFDTEEDGITVIPTSGAVIKSVFNNINKNSNNILARIKSSNGKVVPYGARIYDRNNQLLGTIGQNGIGIVSLPEKSETLIIKWKEAKDQRQCSLQSWVPNKIKKSSGEPHSAVEMLCHINNNERVNK